MTVTTLHCCCRHREGFPRVGIAGIPSFQRKMEQGKMEDKRGKVTEVDGIQNLGRSKMFHCMRRDISVCVMVVV